MNYTYLTLPRKKAHGNMERAMRPWSAHACTAYNISSFLPGEGEKRDRHDFIPAAVCVFAAVAVVCFVIVREPQADTQIGHNYSADF